MVYLAVNYGAYEGWKLEEYETPKKAIEAVQCGATYGNQWKILKELIVEIANDEEYGLVV